MDYRFYQSTPNAGVEWPVFDSFDSEPDFTFVVLERSGDPDANNQTGFDFYGAYGDGELIDAWAAVQPLQAITQAQLPNPVTFYPDPFNVA
jgi:hypothetical protein